MSEPTSPAPKALSLPELAQARTDTEVISQFLQEQLVAHLETLRPLFDPERLLGKHMGAKTVAAFADKALAQLQQSFTALAGAPLEMPREFDPAWLTHVGNTLDLYRWEYTHEARAGTQTKKITMTHPARWVLAFKSGTTLAQFARAIGTRESRSEGVRQFAVNALVLNAVLARNPGLAKLLTALRFELRVEEAAETGKLPLVIITALLPSFRPTDDLILAATAFSGVPAFIELIDMDSVRNLEDPLKLRIAELLGGQ